MRWPGIEPGSTAWKAAMLTTIPPTPTWWQRLILIKKTFLLHSVLEAILTCRQPREQLRCLYENLMSNVCVKRLFWKNMNCKRLLLDLVCPWRTEEHKVVTFRGTDRQVMGSCDRLIRPRRRKGVGGGGGGWCSEKCGVSKLYPLKIITHENFTPRSNNKF